MKRILLVAVLIISSIITKAQGPKNLTVLDTINIGQSLAGVWHYRHASGSEYAIVGAAEGICIVDITTPSASTLLMQLPGVSSIWHEVKVLGDFAYAVSEGNDPNNLKNGLQIIDLRYLPDSAPNKFYTGDGAIANQLVTSHSITAAGNTVFLNGHNITALNQGVLFLDVTDPWNPVYVGSENINYCHDSYVRDNFLYTSDIYAGLFSIFDITNLSSPILQATQLTPGLFNHNTWLSDDGRTLFAADEKVDAPLASFDVSDFGNISLLDTFYNGNFTSNEVHNVRVINDYVICPSYGSQLTIVDGQRPRNMIEIANYPTGGYLCWDADPYTTSGAIVATDMTGILYVFAPNYQRACYLEGIVTDSVTGTTLNGVDVTIQGTGINAQTNPLGEFYTGYADAGTYTVTFVKAGYVTQTHSFIFQNGVVDTMSVRLVPIGAGIANAQTSKLTIYPNPASEKIFITTELQDCDFRVFDVTSKVVMQGHFNGPEKYLETNELSSGTYTIELVNGLNKIQQKILINN